MARGTVKAVGQRKFSAENWNYIYVFLGFILTIEGTLVSLLNLTWWHGLAAFALVAAISLYLFLGNRWFQDRLVRGKQWIEDWR